MTELDRRTLLRRSAAVAAGGAFLGGPYQGIVASAASAHPAGSDHRPGRGPHRAGYGPLQPVPDARDGEIRLELPAGFAYRSFDEAGALLGDGNPIPTNHDGMAAFSGRRGHTVLIRNHEINGPGTAIGDSSTAYDRAARGGTTTVVVDRRGHVADSWVSLNGTQMNCAGGRMPWGSWVSCEETVNGYDVGNDFTGQDNTLLTEKHGYIFEVPKRGRASGDPIRSAGRFAHEAAAYSPHENALYLTEDNFNFPSGFYRYSPPRRADRHERIADGGRLTMLRVRGQSQADLSVGWPVGTTFDVRWVDIDDPDPRFSGRPTNDQAIQYVGAQGRDRGAAIFARLEGAAYDRHVVYFCSTQGGSPDPDLPTLPGFGDGRGQIWAYHTRAHRLRLVYESPSRNVLDLPDNVAVSHRGTLVLCEDGVDEANYLRGLTRRGEIFDFAKNAIAGQEKEEFAGATFSPNGHTLYVNIQSKKGLSFAIWGPWHRGGF